MRVQQRDIIELNYELPNGRLKTHPALVILNAHVLKLKIFLCSANVWIDNP